MSSSVSAKLVQSTVENTKVRLGTVQLQLGTSIYYEYTPDATLSARRECRCYCVRLEAEEGEEMSAPPNRCE